MSSWEKQHIVDAFSFELNRVETKEVRESIVTTTAARNAAAFGTAFVEAMKQHRFFERNLETLPT